MPLIRPFHPSDAAHCHRVFFNAVRLGAAGHYTEAERAAWAPSPIMSARWPAKLANHITYVAQDGDIIGFMTLGRDGFLDLAFVAPDRIGQGVGKAIYAALLADPEARTLPRLATEASLVARPFFLALGWRQQGRQQVERRGVLLTNFRMFRDMPPARA